MKLTEKGLYKIGSISMMMIGVGHLSLHFAQHRETESNAHLINQMKEATINIGFASKSFYDFFHGFSLMMGFLFIFIGLQNFLMARNLRSIFLNNKAAISLPILISGITFVMSVKYFLIPPQALSLIALSTYLWSLLKLNRQPL